MNRLKGFPFEHISAKFSDYMPEGNRDISFICWTDEAPLIGQDFEYENSFFIVTKLIHDAEEKFDEFGDFVEVICEERLKF